MTPINIRPDLSADPWSDLQPATLTRGTLTRIGLLRHGPTGGRATVGMVIETDESQVIIAETTWRLLRGAVRVLAARPVAAEEHDDGEAFRTTMHAAAASTPPRRGPSAVPDDHLLDGLGDLALALGGSPSSWTYNALLLIKKSDLERRGWLAAAMPDLVAAVTIWEAIHPTLTAGQLLELLKTAGDIVDENGGRS
ncbi:hypothetical protein I6A60_01840 [Frankia sp. AgB1.9]|uniref:hypothetical protein n=1 Tax=unclassified Frankia TaxID=2632575 RepID=UPI001931F2BD|nr:MULTISPECIES: hypothetical protein [unclassified Frankia]MBL7546627.1 hypothetical protein [Frankia sp. AgB1.9]